MDEARAAPTDLFTPVFSVSRMAGWTAHVIEQHADNRLIRPDSEYIGERGQKWVLEVGRAGARWVRGRWRAPAGGGLAGDGPAGESPAGRGPPWAKVR